MSNTTLLQLVPRIIKEQELIIGPLAWDEAKKVQGLNIDLDTHTATFIDSDEKKVIDLLVKQYTNLFGDASKAVCKSAVQSIIATLPPQDIPNSLQ